jgi:hypothetical protein
VLIWPLIDKPIIDSARSKSVDSPFILSSKMRLVSLPLQCLQTFPKSKVEALSY